MRLCVEQRNCKGEWESSSDATLDCCEAVASENLAVLVGLEVLGVFGVKTVIKVY